MGLCLELSGSWPRFAANCDWLAWVLSSVGQSSRLIIDWSLVRAQQDPPRNKDGLAWVRPSSRPSDQKRLPSYRSTPVDGCSGRAKLRPRSSPCIIRGVRSANECVQGGIETKCRPTNVLYALHIAALTPSGQEEQPTSQEMSANNCGELCGPAAGQALPSGEISANNCQNPPPSAGSPAGAQMGP